MTAILVTGGARSGKSGFAERLMQSQAERALYIATGQAFDHEMQERITLHQSRRTADGYAWETVEEPLDLPGLLNRQPEGAAVLVDCLTLWLTNVLLSAEHREDRQRFMEAEMTRLEASIAAFQGILIMVTNEVGDGIVPEYALGRLYRDLAGRMNAGLARLCGQVFLVTAGIPVELKSREYRI